MGDTISSALHGMISRCSASMMSKRIIIVVLNLRLAASIVDIGGFQFAIRCSLPRQRPFLDFTPRLLATI